jgi:hypothetical protein
MDWSVDANVSKTHAVSIFRIEMMSWDCKGSYIQDCRRGSLKEWGPIGTSEAETEPDQ